MRRDYDAPRRETRETLRQQHNAAVANGLVQEARRIARVLDALPATGRMSQDQQPATKAGRQLVAEFGVGQFGRLEEHAVAIEAEAAAEERRWIRHQLDVASREHSTLDAFIADLDAEPLR